MTQSLVIDCLAIVSGLTGSALLFFYSFPKSIDLGGLDKSSPSKVQAHFLAKLGFALLGLSYALQLIALLIGDH